MILRESPSLKLRIFLSARGARWSITIRLFPEFAGDRHFRDLKARRSQPFSKAAFASTDLVLICTNHSQVDYGQVKKWASLIVDTRNVLPPDGRKVFRA